MYARRGRNGCMLEERRDRYESCYQQAGTRVYMTDAVAPGTPAISSDH
jgi:hypothetical protein